MEIMKKININDYDFEEQLRKAIEFTHLAESNVTGVVKKIITDVKEDGDSAVEKYSKKFDGEKFNGLEKTILSEELKKKALGKINEDQKSAMLEAHKRISFYHTHQKLNPYSYSDETGSNFSMRVLPMEKVGIYVPGGKASYPSSVIMNAVPAVVAGVKEVIMCVPTASGVIPDLVFAAAAISGVNTIFNVGGAQAIAALAFGTESIPQVDKIVGPGNAYVAEAKRQVFGSVGIDMIAGPSEILIIADETSNADWVAMDLFSQAEHDEFARAILVSTSDAFISAVHLSIERLLPQMPRKEIIEKSLNKFGLIIKVDTLNQACNLSNKIAPEHLELSVDNPADLVEKIINAGSIFLGKFSSESLGDYCAGPNHVLPTSGSARFSSGLSVYDFLKRTSVISISEVGAKSLGKIASVMARGETLIAHAKSAEFRTKRSN